jgi:hypothetical protein
MSDGEVEHDVAANLLTTADCGQGSTRQAVFNSVGIIGGQDRCVKLAWHVARNEVEVPYGTHFRTKNSP